MLTMTASTDHAAEALAMLIRGETVDSVISYGVSRLGWTGEDDPEAHAAVNAAVEKLTAAAHMAEDVRVGLCLAMTQDIYRRASDQNDLATMLRAVQVLAKLPLTEPANDPPEEPGHAAD